MRKIDRFDMYMKSKGLNDNRVTNELSLSVGTIGKSRKEGRDLSDKNIELILNFYTDLNKVWLLTGEGEMLNKEEPQQIAQGNHNIQQSANGNNITQKTFNDATITKFLSMLEKKDEQMQQLIQIIDRITNKQ